MQSHSREGRAMSKSLEGGACNVAGGEGRVKRLALSQRWKSSGSSRSKRSPSIWNCAFTTCVFNNLS